MSSAIELHEHDEAEDLPAWSLPAEAVDRIRVPVTLPDQVTREWAWGGSTGAGVRVCILDSGIELDHPLVGRVDHSVAVLRDEEGELQVLEDGEGDLCGHGTACAGGGRSSATRRASCRSSRTARAISAGTERRAPGSCAHSRPMSS